MVCYFVFIERICSRLNRHISHIFTADLADSLAKYIVIYVRFDLASRSTIVIIVFATITLRSKHRQLWDCEICNRAI